MCYVTRALKDLLECSQCHSSPGHGYMAVHFIISYQIVHGVFCTFLCACHISKFLSIRSPAKIDAIGH